MPEATARAISPGGVVVVPVQPPPQYVLAIVWRGGAQGGAARRLVEQLRAYRDRHGWISGGENGTGHSEPTDLGGRLGWLQAGGEEEALRLLPS
jgi:hypothetical protein